MKNRASSRSSLSLLGPIEFVVSLLVFGLIVFVAGSALRLGIV